MDMEVGGIAEQVRAFIVGNYLMGRDASFEDGDSFIGQGIIDSTGVLELVGFLQDTFEITVEDEELNPQNLDSIKAVSAFVLGKLNLQGANAVAPARVSAYE